MATETQTIEVDLEDDEFMYVALMAHDKDITFNEMINIIIEEHIHTLQEQGNGTSNN